MLQINNQKLIRTINDITLYRKYITGLFSILSESNNQNYIPTDSRYFFSFMTRINEQITIETLLYDHDTEEEPDLSKKSPKNKTNTRSTNVVGFLNSADKQ